MDKWKDIELEKMKVLLVYVRILSLQPNTHTHCSITQVGGNSKAKDFFFSQSDITPGMNLADKYDTKTAALYRDKVCPLIPQTLRKPYILHFRVSCCSCVPNQISTESDGRTWSLATSSARNHKPPSRRQPQQMSDSYQGLGASSSSMSYSKLARILARRNYLIYSILSVHIQGGRSCS